MVKPLVLVIVLAFAVFIHQVYGIIILERARSIFLKSKYRKLVFPEQFTIELMPEDTHDTILKDIFAKAKGDQNMNFIDVAMQVTDNEWHEVAQFDAVVGGNNTHSCYLEVAITPGKEPEHYMEECYRIDEKTPGKDFYTLQAINVVAFVVKIIKRYNRYLLMLEGQILKNILPSTVKRFLIEGIDEWITKFA